MITRWDNVEGVFSIEFYENQGRFLDVWEDEPIHPIVKKYLDKLGADEHGELVIKFKASGYHDQGSMYGGPDNLGWPPESDEERVVTEVYIETTRVIPIDEDDWHELASHYNDGIYEVELEEAI